jgi:glycosyltransferase involved in cell wall biosynthesis
MKIGIFNLNLPVMGGGEQYMGAVAAQLARRHQVELLACDPVDLNEFKARLGVDLTVLPLKILPRDPFYRPMQEASTRYDIFINATYEGLFPAYAPLNLYLVFFPHKLPESSSTDLSQNICTLRGIYPSEKDGKGQSFCWVSGSGEVSLRGLTPGKDIYLKLEAGSFRPKPASPDPSLQLYANCRPVGPRIQLPSAGYKKWVQKIPGEYIKTGQVTLRLDSSVTFKPDASGELDGRELGFVLRGLSISENPLTARFTPPITPENWEDCQEYGAYLRYALSTYDGLISISKYVSKWINSRWERDSDLLYPLIPVQEFAPLNPKKKQILSVGRFFAGFHNKKHLSLVGLFKQMYDRGVLYGFEFHMAGGYYPKTEDDREYMAQVEAEAQGYPIFIHKNISLPDLRKLYSESLIFWHATGYDEDEEKSPELFEHFGITTVEAMASGCIPVVINKAGQPEIVKAGDSGFLWNSLEECENYTLNIINDPVLQEQLAKRAIEESRRFGPQAFAETLEDIISRIGKS